MHLPFDGMHIPINPNATRGFGSSLSGWNDVKYSVHHSKDFRYSASFDPAKLEPNPLLWNFGARVHLRIHRLLRYKEMDFILCCQLCDVWFSIIVHRMIVKMTSETYTSEIKVMWIVLMWKIEINLWITLESLLYKTFIQMTLISAERKFPAYIIWSFVACSRWKEFCRTVDRDSYGKEL